MRDFPRHTGFPDAARRRFLRRAGLGLVIACTLPARSAYAALADAEAMRFMEDLAARALKILTGTDHDLAQREAAVRDLMSRNVAITFLARFALGIYWRRISASERGDYTALFRKYFLQRYAPMIGGYKGQQFKVTGSHRLDDGDVVVESKVSQRNGGPPANVGWRIRERNGELRIVDVIIEGVSMALNQRQEFGSILSSNGFDGLMRLLREKTEHPPQGTG